MNRHQRRATAKKNRSTMGPETTSQALELFQAIQSLEEFSKLAERLRPHLEQLEKLSEELREAETVMEELGQENQALRNELALQREVTIRLFSALKGEPRDRIQKLEATIMGEIEEEDREFKSELERLLPEVENADTDTEEG